MVRFDDMGEMNRLVGMAAAACCRVYPLGVTSPLCDAGVIVKPGNIMDDEVDEGSCMPPLPPTIVEPPPIVPCMFDDDDDDDEAIAFAAATRAF